MQMRERGTGACSLPLNTECHLLGIKYRLDGSGTGSTRTTNALDSFYHSFNSLLSCTHPAVWKLLESLEAQQNHTRSRMLRISRNERIMNLISHYTLANAMDFLRGNG